MLGPAPGCRQAQSSADRRTVAARASPAYLRRQLLRLRVMLSLGLASRAANRLGRARGGLVADREQRRGAGRGGAHPPVAPPHARSRLLTMPRPRLVEGRPALALPPLRRQPSPGRVNRQEGDRRPQHEQRRERLCASATRPSSRRPGRSCGSSSSLRRNRRADQRSVIRHSDAARGTLTGRRLRHRPGRGK
jgi:hypothetical protein